MAGKKGRRAAPKRRANVAARSSPRRSVRQKGANKVKSDGTTSQQSAVRTTPDQKKVETEEQVETVTLTTMEKEPSPEPMDTSVNASEDGDNTKKEEQPSSEDTGVDVTGDGGIMKKIITAATDGAEGPPPPGSEVTAHYTGTLKSDGSKFDSSVDRGEPFKFTIGQGQVIRGWDEGFASMKVGERAILNIRSDYGYGESGSPPKIPANANLIFEVELLGYEGKEKEKEKWDMSDEEKIEKAKTMKAEGTELFTQNDFRSAASKYVEAASYVFDEDDSETVPEDDKQLFTSCWSNAAMCYLKIGQHGDAIGACNNVLKVEGEEKNLKALYRRGLAKLNMEELTGAKKDLMAAFEINSNNKDVRKALSTLREIIAAAKKKERDTFGGFFEKVSMYDDKDCPAPDLAK